MSQVLETDNNKQYIITIMAKEFEDSKDMTFYPCYHQGWESSSNQSEFTF